MADVFVKHVTGGRASSLAHLRQQCADLNTEPVLRLLMGFRARIAGFDVCDNIDNRKYFSDFEREIRPNFLADRRYLTLNVMGFVATALRKNIVVWVPCRGGDIVVHRQHQVSTPWFRLSPHIAYPSRLPATLACHYIVVCCREHRFDPPSALSSSLN